MNNYFKLSLLIISSFSISDMSYSANVISKASPITQVTVFKDRAYVKRRQLVSSKKGNFSIRFQALTSLLDKESLKVSVSSSDKIEILGLRTKKIFLKKSQNKKLISLKEKQEVLNKEIRKISLIVENLIKEHKDLRTLSNHYNESFTLNLHAKKWTKEKFSSFLKFISSRSKKMHSKWKTAFESYIKIFDELIFVKNKIKELHSASNLEKLDVFVDVTLPAQVDKSWVEIQYLVSNVGWSPVYDVRINNRKKSASISQFATVWQKSGENWSKVKIRLSNVRSEIRPKLPSISSYTLSYQEVKKVKTTVKNKIEDVKDFDQRNSNHGEYIEGMAKYFDIKTPQTLIHGMPVSKIFIQKTASSYTEHLELVSNQYLHVFKKGALINEFPFTLASGPLRIYYNNEFVQNTTLPSLVPGKKFFLNAGIDHSIKVLRWHENKKSKKGIINQNKEYRREFVTKLTNFSKYKKSIKILEQIPQSELDSIQVSHTGTTKGLKKIKGFPSWYYWNVNLEAKQDKHVNLVLKITTPKDFNFSWDRQ
jgi:uncharacterized protein (TIGR02231 family)